MLKFNQYLNEMHGLSIDVDSSWLESNLDQLNAELDALTQKVYQNAPIMLAQLRGCLERYGMMLPASATNQFLDLGAELVYLLGDSSYHLYIVYDTLDNGQVEGYAQVVDEADLKDLLGMDQSEILNKEPVLIPKVPYRHRDDDGGNDDEY